MMAKSPSVVILSDDDEVKLSQKSTEYLPKDEQEGEDEEAEGWLPDGWLMVVNRGDDGSIYRYYTSPVTGYTFTKKSEVLQYLFSGMDERFLESEDCAAGQKVADESSQKRVVFKPTTEKKLSVGQCSHSSEDDDESNNAAKSSVGSTSKAPKEPRK